jgi:hypothetical protein
LAGVCSCRGLEGLAEEEEEEEEERRRERERVY